MSHEDECSHEHHIERVQLMLTPSGLHLNVLGLVGEIYGLLKVEDYEQALELVDVAGQMLAAAYRGNYKLLDESYENAVVERFTAELDSPEALAALKKEDESE